MPQCDSSRDRRPPRTITAGEVRLACFGSLVEHSRAGILFESSDRAVLTLNGRLCQIFGVTDPAESFIGRAGTEFVAAAGRSLREADRFRTRIDGIVAEGRPVEGEVFTLRDGRIVELAYVPVRGADGAMLGHAWQYRDITEREWAERALRDAESQLWHSQKLEAVGRLAAGVAHDFNNLLMVIIGYSESLLSRVGDEESYRKDVEMIWQTAERASALTRHLLAFSRKQNLQPKVLDPNALIRDLEGILRSIVREDVEVLHALQPEIGHLEADPGQIEQLILNLVVNAADAMPRGGRIVIETADVVLDEDYVRGHVGARAGAYVLLCVSDTGAGMDEKTRERIFEPFFTTKEGDRTGLGLSTVYGIVKQAAGNIWVYSEPGLGTTFKVYLPRARKPLEAAATEVRPVQAPRGRETLLLVEDEDAVRQLIRDVLRERGYAVLEARHPDDALRISEEHEGPIHLLLTDVVMPRMSGRELADRVLVRHRETKTIYMSGYTAEAIASHGVLEPGTPFVEKPVSPRRMASIVADVLSGKGTGLPRPRSSARRPPTDP